MKTRIIQDEQEPSSPASPDAASAPSPDGARRDRDGRDESGADDPTLFERETNGGTPC